MWRLIDRWESGRLEVARARTAEHLLGNWDRRDDLPDSAFEILDTFELLGYLVVRSKTLSFEDAWINFSGPAIQWWHVLRPGIAQFQSKDATIYEDYSKLADELMTLEAKNRNMTREALIPSEEDLKVFLRGGRG